VTTLLAIDIGNTNVSLGLFDYPANGDAALSEHWRIGTHREQTSDETVLTVRALFRQVDRECEEVTDIVISSVVPPLLPIWERVSTKLFERPPLVVGPGIRTGIPVRYDNPHEVGADRIVNSLAAFELLGGPVIAVDFGTATTFDCVSKDGEYLGGAIFPGIHSSMTALFDRASMLHQVEIVRPRSVIRRCRRLDGHANSRRTRRRRPSGRHRRTREPSLRGVQCHRSRRALPDIGGPQDDLRKESTQFVSRPEEF